MLPVEKRHAKKLNHSFQVKIISNELFKNSFLIHFISALFEGSDSDSSF